MNNLLRNQKGMNDPEQYLSRLQHFSQGLGMPLDQVVSPLGNKGLWVGSGEPSVMHFNVHDEYNMLSTGQHWAAQGALGDASKAGSKRDIGREMNHRKATGVTATMLNPDDISGRVIKNYYDPATSGPMPQQYNVNKFEHTSEYKPALTDIESRWKEINRNRKVDSGVLSAASNFLASPHPEVLRGMQNNRPEMFSSQFLLVNSHNPRDISGPNLHDVIDLNTGNWAEIHPDGYFPT
jgi:hypothetical protein